MTRTSITVTTEIDLDVETAAKWFIDLSDDDMCAFLVRVSALAKSFPIDPDQQWYYLGGHLRNCKCSTEDAREMLRRWVFHMKHSTHGMEDSP